MESAYSTIRHLHITCAVLSAVGFFLRGVLVWSNSSLLMQCWVRIIPHVNDTILLTSAIALTIISSQYPFTTAWLTAKVFGVIAYIILGSIALKAGKNKIQRNMAWLSALFVLAWIASVARSRDPLGFFSRLIN